MTKNPYRAEHLLNDPATRRGVERTKDEAIKQKAKTVLTKAKTVQPEQLDLFDELSLRQVARISGEHEVEDLRREIAALMKLAGINYEVSKHEFWRQYRAKQKAKRDD